MLLKKKLNQNCNLCKTHKRLFSETTVAYNVEFDDTTDKIHCRDSSDKTLMCESSNILHVNINLNERPLFNCEICLKSFSYKSEFKYHMPCRSNKKPFECYVCKKKYKFQKVMINHFRRTHSDELKTVSSSNVLPVRTNTNEYPLFKCEICLKSFSYESEFKYHMPCHSDEKPFECNVCRKKFKLKKCMINHIRRIHPNEFKTLKSSVLLV